MRAVVVREHHCYVGETVDVTPFINKEGRFSFLKTDEIPRIKDGEGCVSFNTSDLRFYPGELKKMQEFHAVVIAECPIKGLDVTVHFCGDGYWRTQLDKEGQRFAFKNVGDLSFEYIPALDPFVNRKKKNKNYRAAIHRSIAEENNTTFAEICKDMIKVHAEKNHDYGDSFGQTMNEYGLLCLAIRLTDKLSRFKTLINAEAQVKDESIIDTLKDMANYAVMGVSWVEDHKKQYHG